jgi:uncharacterized repeat protein (TIGR01451 family)
VVVNDTLPGSLTNVVTTGCAEDPSGGSVCTLGAIAAGASAVYTITGTVSPSAPASISNTATLSATGVPPDAFDDTATTQTTVSVAADLDVEKTLVTTGSIGTGDTIEFRLEVTNNGPSDATGVVATDVLPAGLQFVDSACATAVGNTVTWTIGSLAVGSTVSCQFRATTTTIGPVVNTVSVTGSPRSWPWPVSGSRHAEPERYQRLTTPFFLSPPQPNCDGERAGDAPRSSLVPEKSSVTG